MRSDVDAEPPYEPLVMSQARMEPPKFLLSRASTDLGTVSLSASGPYSSSKFFSTIRSRTVVGEILGFLLRHLATADALCGPRSLHGQLPRNMRVIPGDHIAGLPS